ncbi:hypothetical protein QE418_001546 [Microbacterium testaceum]|nr:MULTISPECIES: hypothetical protein [Microbacterium]MDQ1112098.1 hypothetical protein [Microbacterium testaceum]MDQ1176033.1 hypothetical protein [Microbacterium sp. SORGH_AS_0421]MDR6097367.1 hypothetical protein [Microbacterium sp. SORGH_AS_0454]WAC69985.1 hypothetical protein OVA17_04645 [Microbacterium sp. SL75]
MLPARTQPTAFSSLLSRLASWWPTSMAPRRRRATWQPCPRGQV